MKSSNRIQNKKRQFLSALRTTSGTLPGHMNSLQIKPWVLARWFGHPAFRKKLVGALSEVRRMGATELDLAARAATGSLSRMIAGEIPLDRLMIMVCLGVIELHQQRRAALRGVKARGRATSKPKPTPRLPHSHPSLSEEEAKALLKRLYARQIESDPAKV